LKLDPLLSMRDDPPRLGIGPVDGWGGTEVAVLERGGVAHDGDDLGVVDEADDITPADW